MTAIEMDLPPSPMNEEDLEAWASMMSMARMCSGRAGVEIIPVDDDPEAGHYSIIRFNSAA